jgi:anti-anti-sigma regulatory factor
MEGSSTGNGDWVQVSTFNSIDNSLIATLQPNVDERYLRRLETDISNALQRGDHRTLILDATPLELIDATDFDRLRRVIDTARLMGVETIIVGLKPGVAACLVESDANIEGLITTLNMEKALQIAKRAERRI